MRKSYWLIPVTLTTGERLLVSLTARTRFGAMLKYYILPPADRDDPAEQARFDSVEHVGWPRRAGF